MMKNELSKSEVEAIKLFVVTLSNDKYTVTIDDSDTCDNFSIDVKSVMYDFGISFIIRPYRGAKERPHIETKDINRLLVAVVGYNNYDICRIGSEANKGNDLPMFRDWSKITKGVFGKYIDSWYTYLSTEWNAMVEFKNKKIETQNKGANKLVTLDSFFSEQLETGTVVKVESSYTIKYRTAKHYHTLSVDCVNGSIGLDISVHNLTEKQKLAIFNFIVELNDDNKTISNNHCDNVL